METRYQVEQGDFASAGVASSAVKRMLKQLNVPKEQIKHIVVASFEAEVNIIAHSYGGEIICNVEPGLLRLEFVDRGPGIPDLEQAMQPGFSTASELVREMGYGAGMGLPNISRNCDRLNIKTAAGDHTHITMEFDLPMGE